MSSHYLHVTRIADLDGDCEVTSDTELEHALMKRYDGLNHFRLFTMKASGPA